MALAASVLITSSVVGGGWAYLAQQRSARLVATTRVVTDALAEAETPPRTGSVGGPGRPDEVVRRVGCGQACPRPAGRRRGRSIAARPSGRDARRASSSEQAAAQEQVAEIERDRKLLAELEAIRGNRSEHWNSKQTDREYSMAFRTFGIDLDQLDPKEAGQRIADRSQAAELATYLDDWAWQRRCPGQRTKRRGGGCLRRRMSADPDAWRVALREQIGG